MQYNAPYCKNTLKCIIMHLSVFSLGVPIVLHTVSIPAPYLLHTCPIPAPYLLHTCSILAPYPPLRGVTGLVARLVPTSSGRRAPSYERPGRSHRLACGAAECGVGRNAQFSGAERSKSHDRVLDPLRGAPCAHAMRTVCAFYCIFA